MVDSDRQQPAPGIWCETCERMLPNECQDHSRVTVSHTAIPPRARSTCPNMLCIKTIDEETGKIFKYRSYDCKCYHTVAEALTVEVLVYCYY